MSYSLRSLASINQKVKKTFKFKNNGILAIVVLLIGVFLLDTMGAFIKILSSSYSTTSLAVARNIFGFIPIFLVLMWSSTTQSIKLEVSKKSALLVFIRGISITCAQFCFYLALTKLEFATASTLVFAGPLFLTALSIPILKVSVGIYRWLAVVTGFLGIILIMGIGKDIFTISALLPLGAAFGYALSSITVKLFPAEIPTAQIQLYTQVTTLLGAVILLVITSGYTPILSLKDGFYIFAMGIIGGIGVICLITAYRMTDPSIIAPFEYFGIPFSIILGWIFFYELPISRLFPGVFLIIGAGAIIIWRERIKNSHN